MQEGRQALLAQVHIPACGQFPGRTANKNANRLQSSFSSEEGSVGNLHFIACHLKDRFTEG